MAIAKEVARFVSETSGTIEKRNGTDVTAGYSKRVLGNSSALESRIEDSLGCV